MVYRIWGGKLNGCWPLSYLTDLSNATGKAIELPLNVCC